MKRNYCLSLVLLALLGMSVPYSVVAADNALSSQSTQQAKTITGKVVDVAGEPIIGASVLVKGSSTGSVTDIDGKFSVEAPVGSTLVVSFVGYATEEVKVGAASDYTVTLKDDTQSLSEVVVTAMGIKKEKKALGYSVSDINSKELMKNKQTNVVNSLAGKIPGVNITQAGGAAGAGSNIVIRGGNSASESRDNQPLFVVDGIIYDNSTVNTGNSGTDGMTKTATTFSNRVMDINPEDIESMSVLKGAAAAALYGSRAANGVIIITTKKGEEGAVRVNVSSKYTYSWANKLPEVQKQYGRGEYNTSGAFIDKTMDSWGDRIDGMAYDNIEDFFQGSSVWDNSVSVSGGSKNGSFYLSGSNYHQSGIIPTTGYDKTTFRFNGEQKYGILTVGANVSYSQASTDKTLTSAGLYGQGGNGAMTAVYGWPVDDQMSRYLNDDGSKYRILEGLQDLEDDVENPYWILNKNTLTDETSRFTGAVNASLKLTDWWDVSARAGIDKYTTSSNTLRRPGGAVKQIYQNGYMSKGDVNYQYITTNVMSNFHKTFGDFDLNLLVGTTTEATKITNNTRWGYNFVTEGLYSFNNIIKANQYFKESTVRKRMVGLYGEFRASYKNLVYLTVTGRNDWSSTIIKGNNSYFYPSVSLSAMLDQYISLPFWMDYLKINGAWAQVSSDLDPYSLYATYSKGILYGSTPSVTYQSDLLNANILPQKTTSYEIGLSTSFLRNRLGLDVTYYHMIDKNSIIQLPISVASGFNNRYVNGNTYTTNGAELIITATPIQSKKFTWNLSTNWSTNIRKLTEIYGGQEKYGDLKLGDRADAMYATEWEKTPDGQLILDSNGMPTQSAFKSYIGNQDPDVRFGLQNTFKFDHFTVNVDMDGAIGGTLISTTTQKMWWGGKHPKSTMYRQEEYENGGKPIYVPEGVNIVSGEVTYDVNGNIISDTRVYKKNETAVNIQTWAQNYPYRAVVRTSESELFANTFSRSFLKLRRVAVSYDFSHLIHSNSIKGLEVTLYGNNLAVLKKTPYLDPDFGASDSDLQDPSARYIGVSANITF